MAAGSVCCCSVCGPEVSSRLQPQAPALAGRIAGARARALLPLAVCAGSQFLL